MRAPRIITGLILASFFGGIAVAIEDTPAEDRRPPVILVLSANPAPEDGTLILQARVVDPGGVGPVLLHAMGEDDDDYRSFPMTSVDADTFEARLEPWDGRGLNVVYYIEASDRLGNGPATSGDATHPFTASLQGDPTTRTTTSPPRASSSFKLPWLAPVVGVVLVVGLVLLMRRKQTDQAEIKFWSKLLGPLSDKGGTELAQAIDLICKQAHTHPIRGRVRLERDEILAWLSAIRANEPTHIKRMRQSNRERSSFGALNRSGRKAAQRELDDEMFWLELLAPLLDMPEEETEAELVRLSRQLHPHPVDGIQTFKLSNFRARMRWARTVNPEELVARWKELHITTPPVPTDRTSATAAAAAGVGLVELLSVLALVGVTVGMMVAYLKPIEAPLQTGGNSLVALMEQTRARSISTTRPHRVRPLDAGTAIVEVADGCSSVAWTLDPAIDLDLPDLVTLTATDWSVCFNARGLSSENLIITLEHPDRGSRRLELLRGGVMRWLP